jgi:hypothetical protein
MNVYFATVYRLFTPRCHKAVMDLSFTRRRTGAAVAETPDLRILLSAAAARQSASPTARAAASTDGDARIVSHDDPRISLFAADRPQEGVACSASFSEISDQPLKPRQ